MGLERVVNEIAGRLRVEYPNRDIFISSNLKGNGINLKEADGNLIKEIAKGPRAVFHSIEVPKKSWYKVSNFWRTSFNAGVIEACKSLPYFPGIDVKNNLLKITGIKLGKDVTIAPRVQFDYFYPELITIGDNTVIGDSAKLWTHEYGIDYFAVGEINIGKNVYVGAESIIGPGKIEDSSKIKVRSIFGYGRNFE